MLEPFSSPQNSWKTPWWKTRLHSSIFSCLHQLFFNTHWFHLLNSKPLHLLFRDFKDSDLPPAGLFVAVAPFKTTWSLFITRVITVNITSVQRRNNNKACLKTDEGKQKYGALRYEKQSTTLQSGSARFLCWVEVQRVKVHSPPKFLQSLHFLLLKFLPSPVCPKLQFPLYLIALYYLSCSFN